MCCILEVCEESARIAERREIKERKKKGKPIPQKLSFFIKKKSDERDDKEKKENNNKKPANEASNKKKIIKKISCLLNK